MADTTEEHTGGMVALVPTEEHAAELAHPQGEPQDQLHVTLAYLGDDVTGWDMEQRRQVLDAVLAATAGLGPIEGRAFGHTTFNPDGGQDGTRDPCAVYMIGDTPDLVPARDAVVAGLSGMDLPEQHAPYVPHLTAGYGLTAGDLSYTGPVTLDRVLIALGGEHTYIPLAASQGQPGGDAEMTQLQRYGQGRFREVPAGRAVTASAGRECFPITDDDLELGIVCLGCEHVFETGEMYAERPIGSQGAFEVVEIVCLACAALADTPAPEVTSYGQDRNLPDPEGWVPATIPVVVVEGMPTGDHRIIPAGSLSGHRALPLALMSLSKTSEGGHLDATVIGRIDHLERVPGPEVMNADTGEPFPEGTFVWRSNEAYVNPEHPDYPWVRNGALTGISVDLAETEADLEFDEDGPEDGMLVLRAGRIGASTLCTMPAFPGAHLVLSEDAAAVDVPAGEAPVVASAGYRLETECLTCQTPPEEWFTDPGLTEPTPLTVTPEGRVYGHAADWSTCHIGLPGCVQAPRSPSGYSYYMTGAVLTSDGNMLPVGRLTLGTGHADLSMNAAAAAEHYDDTGVCVADVAAGEDEHGIWLAGALRPGVTDEQIRALRASPPSGDWRPINGALEMVGVLCVNVPGFPIPRPRARVAAGVPTAIVAAGAVRKESPVSAPTPPADQPAVQNGDVVTIGDTGLQGVITAPDDGSGMATVELVVDTSMLNPVEDPVPAEDPLAASADLGRLGGLLRKIRAEQIISRIK